MPSMPSHFCCSSKLSLRSVPKYIHLFKPQALNHAQKFIIVSLFPSMASYRSCILIGGVIFLTKVNIKERESGRRHFLGIFPSAFRQRSRETRQLMFPATVYCGSISNLYVRIYEVRNNKGKNSEKRVNCF